LLQIVGISDGIFLSLDLVPSFFYLSILQNLYHTFELNLNHLVTKENFMIPKFLHRIKPLNEGIMEIKHALDYHIMQALISILPLSLGFTLYSNVHFILDGEFIFKFIKLIQ